MSDEQLGCESHPADVEQLRDLDRVEGGAFAEVVVADEQRQAAAVGHALVLADAADVAGVLAGRLERASGSR